MYYLISGTVLKEEGKIWMQVNANLSDHVSFGGLTYF